jgi:gamma-glutamylputrescine oxidase
VSGADERGRPVWEDGRWSPLPSLRGEIDADVCVVGLGGSGLSAVRRLQELGADVVGVDADAVAGGAAGRNGGLLLAGTADFHHEAALRFGRARATALHRRTGAEIARILEEAPGCGRRTGSLRIASDADERPDIEAQRRAMEQDGLPAHAYDGPEGQGLLFPDDATFDPLARCRLLARRAVAEGGRLYERTSARWLGRGEVVTSEGHVRCSTTIVAVDGGLERVLPELEGRVRTARLQMLATAPTDELALPRPLYLRHGYEYVQRTAAGRLALGGFRDQGGEAEWTFDARPSDDVQARCERFLRERLGVTAPITHRWAASVGFTERRLPIVEEVREGVWALGGFDGTGNVIGAILGRAVAERVAGRPAPDLDLFE